MKAILTIGISASGKSTWAAQYVEEKKHQNEHWLVINQDEIRLVLIKQQKGDMIDEAKELKAWDYDPQGDSENQVKQHWDKLIMAAIDKKYDGIIISDTNLDGGVKKIEKLVNMGIERNDISTQLFAITLEEALERDNNRKFSVGQAVLNMQYDKLSLFLDKQAPKNKLKI